MNICKVYVSGKLNDMAVDYLKNCYKMIRVGKELRDLGFAVYIPCLDLLEGLVDGNFEYHNYFNNSQPWLEAADAVFAVENYRTSKGTLREILRGLKQDKEIFFEEDYGYAKIVEWRKEKGFDSLNEVEVE